MSIFNMAFKKYLVAFIVLALIDRCHSGDVDSHCNDKSIIHYGGHGDFILGGLFDNLHSQGCKPAEQHVYEGLATLHKQEAMVFALDEINKGSEILPNITLGFDIYDTCALKQLAVKQAINQVMYKDTCKYVDEKFCLVSKSDPVLSSDEAPHIGAIGAEWSSITSTISYHFGAFHLPTVSYFSSSDELSDSEMFPYFLRVIPPDTFQVDAMFELMKHFGWKSVAFVYTDDNYGKTAFKRFENKIDSEKDYCISKSFGVDERTTKSDFESIVEQILSQDYTRVVILFTHPPFAKLFFKAMRSKKAVGKFQLIGSDGWGSNVHAIQQHSRASNGALKIRFVDTKVSKFEQYFRSISPDNHNPWFEEFVTKSLRLEEGFSKESGVSRVMDSVLVFAHGLDALLKNECPDLEMECIEQIKNSFNGTYGEKLHESMKELNFIGYNRHNVSFDPSGGDIGRYEMANIQCDDDDECRLVAVGDWNSIRQWNINESAIVWGVGDHQGKVLARCTAWRHPWTNAIIVLDSIGLLFGIIIAGMYLRNRNHPLINASGPGVSSLILFGVIVSYVMVFIFVSKPSTFTCYFMRSGYMVCFTTHFAPLLVHTWTIFRRYKAVKRNTKRPGFTSSSSEIFISLSLILIQVSTLTVT